MQEFHLFPTSGKMLVACSTGIDSMALLQCFLHLKKQKVINHLEVVHVQHNLRKVSQIETDFLRDFCQKNQLILHLKVLQPPKNLTNVEAWARKARYQFFHQLCNEDTYLATAHHLDDSFEWWLMNQLKGSANNVLGIPVYNRHIVRPFLGVTKKQIRHYVRSLGLTYYEDETNTHSRFERNFLRQEVIAKMAERYPKYLKHYALRSMNEWEMREQAAHSSYQKIELGWGTHFIFAENQMPDVAVLEKALKKLSSVERGQLSKELTKLRLAIKNGKKGPMIFSGGVKAFFNRSEILMLNRQGLSTFDEMDQKILQKFQQGHRFSTLSVAEFLKEREAGKVAFSSLVLTDDQIIQRAVSGIRQESRLLPQLTRFFLQNNVWFCSGNQLQHQVTKNPSLLSRKLLVINAY